MNVPRHLPFKIGKIKDAACGGTGNAVVNGEFIFAVAGLPLDLIRWERRQAVRNEILSPRRSS